MAVQVHLDLTPLQHGEPLTVLLVIMVSSQFLFMNQPSTWGNRASCGVLQTSQTARLGEHCWSRGTTAEISKKVML